MKRLAEVDLLSGELGFETVHRRERLSDAELSVTCLQKLACDPAAITGSGSY